MFEDISILLFWAVHKNSVFFHPHFIFERQIIKYTMLPHKTTLNQLYKTIIILQLLRLNVFQMFEKSNLGYSYFRVPQKF